MDYEGTLTNVPVSDIDIENVGIHDDAIIDLWNNWREEIEEWVENTKFNDWYGQLRDLLRFNGDVFLCEFPEAWEVLFRRGSLSLDRIPDLVRTYEHERGGAQDLLESDWQTSEVKEAIRQTLAEMDLLDEGYRGRRSARTRRVNESQRRGRAVRRFRRR